MQDVSLFMRACRNERTERAPVWLMRQAGRYMQEYRDVRAQVGFLDLCRNPDLVAEVTDTAARRLGVDAAIVFADILLIVEALGFNLRFDRGEGPRIFPEYRGPDQQALLSQAPGLEALRYVGEAVKRTRATLPSDMPLIGFAGAPFTVAAYMIEGGGSKNFDHAKVLMRSSPHLWQSLMDAVVRLTFDYLDMQVQAGADALQLFDSWIGHVTREDYQRHVSPYVTTLFSRLKAKHPSVPLIYFGTHTQHLLDLMSATGPDVMGVDTTTPLSMAAQLTTKPLQGNLDPVYLLGDQATLLNEATRILNEARGLNRGFIFNLGHGILPTTPVENALALVSLIRETRWR